MRGLLALFATLLVAMASAERILLIPLDSRPAAGQFAQMIGNMSAVEVRMPPYEMLGRFTRPGSPDRIMDWLESQDLSDVSAVIASTDMLAYGGLIASRVNDVPVNLALSRLRRLADIRRRSPHVKMYLFSATMRLAPTAVKSSASWRADLARYQELRDKYSREKNPATLKSINNLIARIPSGEIGRYDRTRQRNHIVQRELVRMIFEQKFDYLVVGQDDAKQFGPHVPETAALRRLVTELQIGGKVFFCEGIDQHSNILVSRALLRSAGWMPKVRVVWSDDRVKNKFAVYESKTIEESLNDQLMASGARPMGRDGAYDYSLYVNVPGRSDESFAQFRQNLVDEVDQGFPVGVADINLGKDGTADADLFDTLWNSGRMMKLLAYAGWNTAGNTMGTTLPAANVYLLSRRQKVDPLLREVAQREFLLHRFVNDYAYHKFVRPEAYRMIDAEVRASREETDGPEFERVNNYVQQDMQKYLLKYFSDQFLGRRFFAGNGQYVMTDLTNIKVFLPWPRAYEVRLEFHLTAKPVGSG